MNKIMATFFGEILPVTSRAVDDDEDEDDVDSPDCDMWIRWTETTQADLKAAKDGKLGCDTLIVAIGPAATGFSRSYILHQEFELIGGLFAGVKDNDCKNTFQSPTDRTCYLYRNTHNPRFIVCQCNTHVAPEQSFSFVSQLFAAICSDETGISILCSCSVSEYKSDIAILDMQPPFLRALKTEKFTETPLCAYLEQPNVIAGLPAHLLSMCQVHGHKAVLYCCFTDTIYLSSAMMKTYLPLLTTRPLKEIVQKNPHAEETLKKIVSLHTSHNTLYL